MLAMIRAMFGCSNSSGHACCIFCGKCFTCQPHGRHT
jgi:hypothetical protein